MRSLIILCIAAAILYNGVITAQVSQTDCMDGTTDQCATIENAECDNAASKCKCSDGYREDSADGSTCVKKTVSETDCMQESTDLCAAINNAECDNTGNNPKCQCSDGFKEDSADGSTCVKIKVSETDCMKDSTDQCASINNAECDNTGNKCQCSDGYKEDSADGSTCVKNDEGNSTPSFVLAANMISVPLLVTLYLILC